MGETSITKPKREIAVGNRTTMVKIILIVLLAWALVGCGDKDEAPPESQSSQTPALVPDSVAQDEDILDVVPAAAEPLEVAEPQSADPAQPLAEQPAEVVEEFSTPVVEEESTPPPPPAGTGVFSLQLGSYTVAAFAEEKAAELRDLGHPGTVEQAEVGGQLYHRVFIRGLSDRQSAEKLGEELHSSLGLSYLIRRK